MLPTVALLLSVLIAAGVVLGLEARSGALEQVRPSRARLRIALFFSATVAGGALLVASAGGEWLFALAMLPVTVLSLMRFVMLGRAEWASPAFPLVSGLVFALAVSVFLQLMPYRIDRHFFRQEIRHYQQIHAEPPSIRPDAGRTVRV